MKPFLSLACAALVVLGGLASTVHSQEKPAQRFAFLNVSKGFDTYRKYQESIDKLRVKREGLVTQLKGRATQIEQEESGKLQTLNPGTPEHTQLKRDLALARYLVNFDREQMDKDIDAENRKMRKLIYKEICQEADNYAREQGLAAVFSYVSTDSAMFEQEPDLFAATRDVLFRSEEFDVTEAVVKRLNALLPPPAVKAPDPVKSAEPK